MAVNSSSEIRVLVLSYRVLHMRNMAISSLRSFRRELLLLGESALKSGFSFLDECRIVQSDEVDLTKVPHMALERA